MSKPLPQVGGFSLMPCAADVCQACAVKHDAEQPHNAQSLYYQYRFYADHQRWPTWGDALAHCTPEVQAQWREGLLAHGVKPEQLEPSKAEVAQG